MDIIFRKLSSQHGESIAEVLVAALVIALGSILLITMINTSFRLLTNEEKSYKEFIEAKNEFEKLGESALDGNRYVTISTEDAGGTLISLSDRIVKVYSRKVSDETTFYRYEPLDLDSGD